MNTLFYWENNVITFYERKELCNYLDLFMKKCFSITHIINFLEILQKKITIKSMQAKLLKDWLLDGSIIKSGDMYKQK